MPEEKTIRVLVVNSVLDEGGIEKVLYNYYANLSPDRFQVDFMVTAKQEGILEKRLKDCGAKVFHVCHWRKSISTYFRQVREILRNGKYDVIHENIGDIAVFSLLLARRSKVPVRIAHAHGWAPNERKRSRIKRLMVCCLTKINATDLFACSENAGEWMWGKRKYRAEKVQVIRNPIDVESFAFSMEKRAKYRKELHLCEARVIGYVARIHSGKNHLFLLEILHELIHGYGIADMKLILVGDGELRASVQARAEELNLSGNVLFLGMRWDVPDLINAFDLAVIPSEREGFCLSMLEAQCNGLHVIASDRMPRDAVVSDLVTFVSLNKTAGEWAEIIRSQSFERVLPGSCPMQFDIRNNVREYADYLTRQVKLRSAN